MKGLNKAQIIGHLGQDPEIRYSANGSAVVNVSVATTESWKDKEGKTQEATTWHRIVMFGKLAEIAGQYLKKGSQAYFEGKIQTRKWQDKDGSDRYSTEIVAKELQMLGGGSGQGSEKAPQKAAESAPETNNNTAGSDGFDEIPFAPVLF